MKVRVTSQGREAASRNVEANLLSPNHWSGVGSAMPAPLARRSERYFAASV
jgi:hypothetical protein